MKLTKDGQKAYDKLKKQGLTDVEMADGYLFPMEYESEDEKQKDLELMKKIVTEARAKRTPEEQKELDEFVEQLRKDEK